MANLTSMKKGTLLIAIPFMLPLVPPKPVPHVAPVNSAHGSFLNFHRGLSLPKGKTGEKSDGRRTATVTASSQSGSCLCHQAASFFDKGAYARAAYLYRQASIQMAREFGPNSTDVALMRYDEGRAFHEQAKYSTAISLYNESLQIYSKNPKADRTNLAWVHWAMGSTYSQMKAWEESVTAFNTAVGIYERMKPSKEYADCLRAFADCYQRQGKNAEAKTLIARAQEVERRA